MKKIIGWALVLCLTLATVAALAWSWDDHFVLKMQTNPTTGYDWQYKVENPKLLEVEQKEMVTEKDDVAGAGGVREYILKGIDDGKTSITFFYARSWEDKEPICSVTYSVETDDDGDVEVYQSAVNPGL